MSEEILYVITPIFNPEGSEIRYKLYRDFKAYMATFSNVVLITIELAQGDKPFVVTTPYDPWNIQVRSNDVLWWKENLINVALKWLYERIGSGKVAWIDGDMVFTNEKWVDDTLRLLNDYKFVQMFDTCDSLGPDNEVIQSGNSFVYRWIHGIDSPKNRGRSGGAWASCLDVLESIGWLIDWDVVGASDWYTVFGLTNQACQTVTPCRAKNERWMERVREIVNGNIYYVDGTLVHFFHGWPSDRGYGTRGRILIDNEFDPDSDIGYLPNGLLHFTSDKPQLRFDLIEHFKSKNTHGADDIRKADGTTTD